MEVNTNPYTKMITFVKLNILVNEHEILLYFEISEENRPTRLFALGRQSNLSLV